MRRGSIVLLLLSVWLPACLMPSTAAWALRPYFGFCNVKSYQTSGGMNSLISAQIYDPDGSAPATISGITVEGPNGFPATTLTMDNYDSLSNTFSTQVTGVTASTGQYVFTVLNTAGETATSYYWLASANSLPLVDSSTLNAYPDKNGSMLTPTLTWTDSLAGAGYTGSYFFKVRIYDANGNPVWTSGPTGATGITVPAGILSAGTTYQWSVVVLDNSWGQAADNGETADNGSESDMVPLTAAAGPGFLYARVYSLTNAGSTSASTVLDVQAALPSGDSINSLTVTDPGGNSYTLSLTGSDYTFAASRLLADGTYTFTATDVNGVAATSYHYFKSATIPPVDPTTLQACGSSIYPTLTWAAPQGAGQPLFYSASIYDSSGNIVLSSRGMPGLSWQTASAGSQVIQSGQAYTWSLDVQDSRWPNYPNNVSRTNQVNLVVDNSRPNFLWGAGVLVQNGADGISTSLSTPVNDPSGAGLSLSMSLVATGPNNNSYTFGQADLAAKSWPIIPNLPGPYEYLHAISGVLPNGTCAFTLNYTSGQLTSYDSFQYDGIPVPISDETAFQVTGDPTTPTVSWNAIAGYSAHLYYRLVVEDSNDVIIYQSPKTPYTWQTVPASVLKSGQNYQYRVEAFNDPGWPVCSKRSYSHYFPLQLTTNSAPGTPAGVQAAPGNGQAAVSFQTPALDGGSPITGYTVTASDGTTASGASSPIVVPNLTNGVAYTFTVTATNAIGTGQPSAASNTVMPSQTCLASSAGVWNLSVFSITAGNGMVFRARGSQQVGADGSYSGSYTDGNGNITTFSGTLWSFPYGLWSMDSQTPDPNFMCQVDQNGTVSACTRTANDGSALLMIGAAQAASYSLADDAAGGWNANILDGTAPAWQTMTETVNKDGTWGGTLVTSGQSSAVTTSGTVALSSSGALTNSSCNPAAVCPAEGLSFLAAGKTVAIGTSGSSTSGDDFQISVFTKQASSYSPADLAGNWNLNRLSTSGKWARGNVQIDQQGNSVYSVVNSDGTSSSRNGKLSIASNGLISCPACSGGVTFQGAMDSGKTVWAAISNKGGNSGEYAISIFTKAVAVPGAPAGVTATAGPGDDQVTVSFTPPISTGGSPIQFYTATSSLGDTATGTGNSIAVGGLTSGAAYTFTVTATNAFGTGPASAPSNQVTVQGTATVPGKPVIVSLNPGDSQVAVNFSAPPSGGSSITSYMVSCNPGGMIVPGAGSPISVTGLTNGTSYTFTVSATNAKGTGSPSDPGIATPAAHPGAPANVTASACSAEASVSFTPPSNGGSPITSYTVTSSDGRTASGLVSPIIMTGLTSGTAYTFTVTATNAVGTGPASGPSNSVTVGKSFSGLNISGPASVCIGGSGNYVATASYCDGSAQVVSPAWSLDSTAYASIDPQTGVLTPGTVTSDQSVTVDASYSDASGITQTASLNVAIIGQAVLQGLSIAGLSDVASGGTATYTATASYSDGSQKIVNPAWSLDSSTYASIDPATGVLNVGTSASGQTITVSAGYTEGGATQTASEQVIVGQTLISVSPIIVIGVTDVNLTSNYPVNTMISGPGGLSYAGGLFNTAGGVSASNIAEWDGSNWNALGTGLSSTSGLATVYALTIAADGSLYAAGTFDTAGAVSAANIAKWDGSNWYALGAGISSTSGSAVVSALAVGPDGAVYAAGTFDTAGSVSAANIAKWDGSNWYALGTGISLSSGTAAISALAIGADGSLYAAGTFDTAGAVSAANIAKWDGSNWYALGTGISLSSGTAAISALAIGADGSLYAAGTFDTAGSVSAANIAKWDGANWYALGTGISLSSGTAAISALAIGSDGSLYAAGTFDTAGAVSAANIAKWDGSTWYALGTGISLSSGTAVVRALTVDSSGLLYAGGYFDTAEGTAGSVQASNTAMWDGSSWSALGSGISGQVLSTTVLTESTGLNSLLVSNQMLTNTAQTISPSSNAISGVTFRNTTQSDEGSAKKASATTVTPSDNALTTNVGNASRSTQSVSVPSGITPSTPATVNAPAVGNGAQHAAETPARTGGAEIDNSVLDRVLPTLSISAPSVSTTGRGPVAYTVAYSGHNGAISLSDANIILNKTGSATGTVTVSGGGNSARTVTISSIKGDGALGIGVAAGTAKNSAGPESNGAVSETFSVNNTPPSIKESFTDRSIALNGSTSLTFTIKNRSNYTALTRVGFSDKLPAGLVISKPNGLSGSCGGGTITAIAGTNEISLSGATLPANSSCTFSANVTGTKTGALKNTTGKITSAEAGRGNSSYATLVVK
jgi:hypothetical protein